MLYRGKGKIAKNCMQNYINYRKLKIEQHEPH